MTEFRLPRLEIRLPRDPAESKILLDGEDITRKLVGLSFSAGAGEHDRRAVLELVEGVEIDAEIDGTGLEIGSRSGRPIGSAGLREAILQANALLASRTPGFDEALEALDRLAQEADIYLEEQLRPAAPTLVEKLAELTPDLAREDRGRFDRPDYHAGIVGELDSLELIPGDRFDRLLLGALVVLVGILVVVVSFGVFL